MADNQTTNQRFAPEWDSEDTSDLDEDINDQSAARDTETGAVIGVIGGAVVGALAGGPVGAVVGGVLGGVGGGAGVAAVEKYEHAGAAETDVEDADFRPDESVDANPMSSPYPGDAGRPEALQYNGVGIYDAPDMTAPQSPASTFSTDVPDRESGTNASRSTQNAPNLEPPRSIADEQGNIRFALAGYSYAKQVSVVGPFNDWSPAANVMQRDATGWSTTLQLEPGKHAYKFVVDGQWMRDPNNPEYVDDGAGDDDSIIVVERDIVNPDRILRDDYPGQSQG